MEMVLISTEYLFVNDQYETPDDSVPLLHS